MPVFPRGVLERWGPSIGLVEVRIRYVYVLLSFSICVLESCVNGWQASSMLPIEGPKDANYRLTTSIGHDALVWSECGVSGPLFNVNSQAVVKCDKDAYLGVDTQDTKFVMELHLQWKKC